jgi:hypothetical protein
MSEQRPTSEMIFGDFGFRLEWLVQDHWADVKVYLITARDGTDNTPFYNIEGWTSSHEQTTDIAKAEKYLEGFVKWDGCAELSMGQPHWCGGRDFAKHCALLKHIWTRAFELMGRAPQYYDVWIDPPSTGDLPAKS